MGWWRHQVRRTPPAEFAFLPIGTRPYLAARMDRVSPELESFWTARERGECYMDNIMLIRIIAGVLFVIVLVLLVQRRRTRVK